jgi:predicted dehydrogenase
MSGLRVGIVGTGMAAESHAFDIVSHEELELVAVCSQTSVNATSFAARFGAKQAFSSVADMLDSRLCESVVVAVPPHAVLDVTRLVLDHRLSALIEKPVATSQQSLAVLADIAETAEAPAVAAFNRRYQRHVRTAVEILATQELGQVKRLTASWSGPYESRYAVDAPTYRSRARSRHGLIADTGSHILDLLVWMFGDALTVDSCHVTRNERGADIGAIISLGFGDLGQIQITMSDDDTHPGEQRCIEVEATHGKIIIDEAGAALAPAKGPDKLVLASEYRRPVDDLLALRDGGTALGASLHDALQVSRLLIAAYDQAGVPTGGRWQRPRFKPWGRLNGSC